MYLKSIEIHGFKSFANRIKFEFHNGITGIVGPNGSGKSNVADAVRWVLGEQRIRQLRGSSMQDVIFAGTEMRKPMGYAYVAITLDNSDHQLDIDFDEVTVARRLYRSGESEYLINGTVCRLKDVAELFYDTGIGKEGYSIIGQGQIDKILSDKPEDRRELFDEAAGIVKFKRRKETTVKKLESEQENLVRVSDILAELEKQVGPLERQSEKAKIYLKTREDQKHLDINVFLIEHGLIQQKLDEAEKLYAIAQSDLEKARAEAEENRTGYDSITAELEELEKRIEEARGKITEASVVREQLEGQIKVYEERIRAAKNNTQHFETRREAVKADVERISKEKDTTLTAHHRTEETLAEMMRSRETEGSALDGIRAGISNLQERIEEDKSGILSTLDERANIKSRLASITTRAEQINIRKAELTSKLVLAKTEESQQDKVIAKAEESFRRVSTEVAGLEARKREIEKELLGIKPKLAASDEILRNAQIRYKQQESQLETLRNLTERYEGFGNSVRRVMEEKKRDTGLIGVVADLFKTEEKYETAVETALGGNIQNIVTETPDTARRMIELLKREKAGRATFLPLSSLTDPQEFRETEALHEKGVIGLASELIECDERYRNAAKTLLGRILVVDTFDNARALQHKFGQKLRVVTLEGELFAPGGSISGGAFRNNSNLLGRRREIAELKAAAGKSRQLAEDAQRSIDDLKRHRNDLRTENDLKGSEIQRKLIEQNTARLTVTQEKERAEEQAGSLEQLRMENDEIREQMEALAVEKTDMQERLSASEAYEKEKQAEILDLTQQLESLKSEEAEKSSITARWDVEIEKIRQTSTFEQQNLGRLEEEYRRFADDLSEIEEGLVNGREEIVEKQRNIEEISRTIAASADAQTKSKEQMETDLERRSRLMIQQKEFLVHRDELTEEISALDKEQYRLETQKDKLQESIDSGINYLWDEYQVTPSDAARLRDEELTDLSEMKKQVADLKKQIRDLGPVNVNAIEDYKNLMERYTFLKTQHDDLVEAAENLQKIIADLDEGMRRQFREQFERINAEFNHVFREMFGGGHGSLELMEDEDILVAGVRVVAQPPGKKLVNMMQMSGGEKALTAISLLFAIQNLKPSPFCLLDEIEAALDESNVGRYADYLHKLTDHTQFIVITHRRGTMERADRLYGITMQEKGVSALVSVNLIEKDLTG